MMIFTDPSLISVVKRWNYPILCSNVLWFLLHFDVLDQIGTRQEKTDKDVFCLEVMNSCDE